MLALIAYSVTVVQGIVGLFGGGLGAVGCGGLGLIVPVVILIYLLRGDVRAAFVKWVRSRAIEIAALGLSAERRPSPTHALPAQAGNQPQAPKARL